MNKAVSRVFCIISFTCFFLPRKAKWHEQFALVTKGMIFPAGWRLSSHHDCSCCTTDTTLSALITITDGVKKITYLKIIFVFSRFWGEIIHLLCLSETFWFTLSALLPKASFGNEHWCHLRSPNRDPGAGAEGNPGSTGTGTHVHRSLGNGNTMCSVLSRVFQPGLWVEYSGLTLLSLFPDR